MHCRRFLTFETMKKKEGFSEIKGMLETLYYSEHHTERKESCITYHASFRRKNIIFTICVHVLRMTCDMYTFCELVHVASYINPV
jgi:hypothetical protein